MSKRRTVTLALVATAGLLAGLLGSQVVGAQTDAEDGQPVTVEELTRHDLVTAEGKEAVVLRARFAPGAAMAGGESVEHPGEEFVYVVEGSPVLTREGEDPIQFAAGDAWYNDQRQAHTLENGSSSEPFTVVAIWIGDQGEVFEP